MQDIRKLRAERADVLRDARALVEGQPTLSREAQRKFDAFVAKADKLEREIEIEEREQERTLGTAKYSHDPRETLRDSEGREVRLYLPNERISDSVSDDGNMTWTSMVEMLVLGNQRDYEGQDTVTGSALVLPPRLEAQLIDAARPFSQVVTAGARTVYFDAPSMVIPQVAEYPTVMWKAENAAITPSNPTFQPVTLSPKTCTVLTQVSVELVEDSDIGSAVMTVFGKALAEEIDRVALFGAGTAVEPEGLSENDGIQDLAISGVLTGYRDFAWASQLVAEANGKANAAILSPNAAGQLDRLSDGVTENPLVMPDSCKALKWLTTSKTDDGGTSTAFVGDFTKLLIGIRSQTRLEASRDAGFETLSVWLRGYVRMDVAVVEPPHFVMLSDIEDDVYSS